MIYIVRHGQTDWNLFKRFSGSTEVSLNQTGIEQSERLAEKLKEVDFDMCFCSPQKRAHQTCEIIHRGSITFDDRLIELKCGEFEGTEENAESFKLFFQAIRSGSKGTEKFADFMKRVCDFCDMILKEYKEKDVLIVTHAANVRIMNYYFNDKPQDYDFTKPVSESGGLITFSLIR